MFCGQRLRYQLEKGKTYSYSAIVVGVNEAFLADIDYSIEVNDAKEGVYTLTVVFQKWTVKATIAIHKISNWLAGMHDSTIVMKGYIDKRIKVIMTDRGKILSTVPIDTMETSDIFTIGNIDRAPTPISFLKRLFIEFPEKEMAVYDSWKENLPDTTTIGGLNMVREPNIKYTIAGAETRNGFDCWKITFRGASTSEGIGTQMGYERTRHETEIANGNVYFVPAKGIFMFFEHFEDWELKINDTKPEKISVRMANKTSTTVSFVK
jgi:hypothetical protein